MLSSHELSCWVVWPERLKVFWGLLGRVDVWCLFLQQFDTTRWPAYARQCESRTWYPVCFSTQTSTNTAEIVAKRCPLRGGQRVRLVVLWALWPAWMQVRGESRSGSFTRCSHRMTMPRASFRAQNATTTRWPKRTKLNRQTSHALGVPND